MYVVATVSLGTTLGIGVLAAIALSAVLWALVARPWRWWPAMVRRAATKQPALGGWKFTVTIRTPKGTRNFFESLFIDELLKLGATVVTTEAAGNHPGDLAVLTGTIIVSSELQGDLVIVDVRVMSQNGYVLAALVHGGTFPDGATNHNTALLANELASKVRESLARYMPPVPDKEWHWKENLL